MKREVRMDREWWIRGGRLVRRGNPTVIQYRSGKAVEIRKGATESLGFYQDAGAVMITVVAEGGKPHLDLPELEALPDRFGPDLTTFEFHGDAHVRLDETGKYLVVRTQGVPHVTGVESLPLQVTEGTMVAAMRLDWLSTEDDPPPHAPFRMAPHRR